MAPGSFLPDGCYSVCVDVDCYIVALNIRNDEAERLVAELARRTGETKTEAVIKAVRDRLARIRGGRSRVDELEEIAERCSRLPVRDGRRPDDVLGYGDDGLPR